MSSFVRMVRSKWLLLVGGEALIWLMATDLTFREPLRRSISGGSTRATILFDRPGFVETVLSHSIELHLVAVILLIASLFFRWQWRRLQRTKQGAV